MANRLLGLALVTLLAGCTSEWDPERKTEQAARGSAGTLSPSSVPAMRSPILARVSRGNSGRPAFASLPDRGRLLAYDASASIRQSGAYSWHPVRLSERHALSAITSSEMELTTPDGRPVKLRYERHIEHPNGNWTWIGQDQQGADAVITFGEAAVIGSIPLAGEESLRLTVGGGRSWLVATDPTKVVNVNTGGIRDDKPDFLVPPAVVQAIGDKKRFAASSAELAAAAAAGPTVDLVLGYTSGLASALGGASQAVTRLTNLVDITNEAYANSQIVAQVRLVHAVQVAYPDATDNGEALRALTGRNENGTTVAIPPPLLPLRAARDQYGGDLVSLVRDFQTPQNAGCGIAWLIGGDGQPFGMADEPYGYSVVSDGQDLDEGDSKTYFCRDETLAHELGHNMGQAHNMEDSTSTGAHPYSYGYREASSSGFYTVMAYRLARSSQGAIRYFANPDVSFAGRATGVVNVADNARSLRQTMPVIATFRTGVTPTPNRVRNDVDNDGRSDIVWYHGPSQTLAYWVMNGATVTRSGGQVIGGNYQALSTGDYNGDGLGDVLTRGPTGDLRMFIGNGSTFAGATVSTYPSGWQVVGARKVAVSKDIDGDRKSDITWFHAPSQTLAYWVMNGATVTRSGGQVIGGNYQALSTGDYNGDGLEDVISRGPTGDLRMWIGDGSVFAGAHVGTYPAGWENIGSADIDGDNKSDIIWFHPPSQTLAYWVMNGSTLVRSGGQALGANYQALSTGDYNGDGLADVISRGPTGDLRMWVGDGSVFAGAHVGTYSAGWDVIWR